MKKLKLGIILIAGIAVLAGVYVSRKTATDKVVPPNSSTQALSEKKDGKRETRTSESKATASLAKTASLDNKPAQKDIKRLFAESRNYWDYAHDILPSAKAG